MTAALPVGSAPIDRAALVARARDSAPLVRLAAARVTVASRALAEAEHDLWPDFSFGAGYRLGISAPGGTQIDTAHMVGAEVGMTLPVFFAFKQGARVREQSSQLAATRAAADDVALQVETSIEVTIDALERLDRELVLYREELVPQAEQAVLASIADYQVGSVGFVSVLQNWRTQLDVRLAHERLLADQAEQHAVLLALVRVPQRKTP